MRIESGTSKSSKSISRPYPQAYQHISILLCRYFKILYTFLLFGVHFKQGVGGIVIFIPRVVHVGYFLSTTSSNTFYNFVLDSGFKAFICLGRKPRWH